MRVPQQMVLAAMSFECLSMCLFFCLQLSLPKFISSWKEPGSSGFTFPTWFKSVPAFFWACSRFTSNRVAFRSFLCSATCKCRERKSEALDPMQLSRSWRLQCSKAWLVELASTLSLGNGGSSEAPKLSSVASGGSSGSILRTNFQAWTQSRNSPGERCCTVFFEAAASSASASCLAFAAVRGSKLACRWRNRSTLPLRVSA
mmetsp:Transcript_126388/g.404655  ORF Transcript_126388/g.404655 Transcript_126388/m.404655 type:complete len:202 (-) Transcript_126388:629-1234(-)